MTEAQLDAAAVAAGAFAFAKSEDGAWSKDDKNEFFFNSTGDSLNSTTPGNHLGRNYRLNLNEDDVTGPCTLTILYNTDQVLAAGFDISINPDNIDVSKDYVMVCEDGTGFGRTVMANKGRDGLIWRYDLKNNYAATAVVRLNPPGRDSVPVGPGVWETSGIIDAKHFYGRNTWLFVVQAHPPTVAPVPAPTLPSATGPALAAAAAAWPMARSGLARWSPTERSKMMAPATCGTTVRDTAKPRPCSSSHCITPQIASRP